jgi:hypothetical protein
MPAVSLPPTVSKPEPTATSAPTEVDPAGWYGSTETLQPKWSPASATPEIPAVSWWKAATGVGKPEVRV